MLAPSIETDSVAGGQNSTDASGSVMMNVYD